tara:strand:+ start:229 stop:1005 length:777 start_codon:yes stop_codon:yes gene_type:complete
MNPKVAIIIANYNYEKYVIKAINSALNQTYQGEMRIYIVDDGSSDSSWSQISEITDAVASTELYESFYAGSAEYRHRDNIFAYRIKNSGASVARNVAMWQAMEWAEVFGILDSDDEYYPEKVEKLVEKLNEHEEVGVAYADYKIVTPDYSKEELKESYSRDVLLHRCMVHSNSLIKKEYIKQVLLPKNEIFDSRLHGPGSQGFVGCTEDYDLWLRLSKVCIMSHVPECLAIANEHGNNQSLKMTNEIFNHHAQILGSR